jgi:NAD(P)-dependent dehydrogenase (short-subunit alcohol dehydrogenase family)
MPLYRSSPEDGVWWVTGASSGIGRGVALEAARRGFSVVVTARRIEVLEELACEAKGLRGRIIPLAGDICDRQGMVDLVKRIERDYGPVTLAFLNAGTYRPVTAYPFDAEAFHTMFATNVGGTINGLEAVLPYMAERKRGQIALNASVAGYIGLPRSAAYSGTKAALIAMAESLKFDTDKLGISLQIVNPGFVETPLTAKNDHPMPFLMPLEEASRLICDGFAKGGFEITFPWQLSRILKTLRLLPYAAYFWLVSRATQH